MSVCSPQQWRGSVSYLQFSIFLHDEIFRVCSFPYAWSGIAGIAGCAPLLWIRHDRSPPERVRVFVNDEQYYGRSGVASKTVTNDDRGYDIESIDLDIAGHKALVHGHWSIRISLWT